MKAMTIDTLRPCVVLEGQRSFGSLDPAMNKIVFQLLGGDQ